MASIEEILARAKPRTEVVSICLAGNLRAEHARLTAELDRVAEQAPANRKMAQGNGEARELAAKIQLLETEMGKAEQEFQFAGISEAAFEELRERFPAREGKRETWNVSSAGPALVAACSVDPQMSEAQAILLRKTISQGDWDTLVETAWAATTSKDQSIPFSERASALTTSSGSK